MKPKYYLVLRVLAYFLLLFLLQDWLSILYRSVLQSIGFILSSEVVQRFDCSDACFIHIITYVSLVLATPQLTLVRRVLVLVSGLSVFVGLDLVSVLLWPDRSGLPPLSGESLFQAIFDVAWGLVRELLLPILLWIVAVDRHLGLFFSDRGAAESLREEEPFSVR